MDDNSTPENNNPFAVAKPDWDAWKGAKRALLWQAIALLLNIEPKHVPLIEGGRLLLLRQLDHMPDFFHALDKAIRAVEIGHLRSCSVKQTDTETAEVDLAEFAQWAEIKGYPIPLEFPGQDAESTVAVFGWPWGQHDTKLLQDLAAAANKWWKNYDPADPGTAPTNEVVIAWLKDKRKTSDRSAAAIATILRADGLPTGPRK